jgi:beta-galactosidase
VNRGRAPHAGRRRQPRLCRDLERSTRTAPGVEIVRRTNGRDRFQFVLNYSASEFRAVIDAPGVDLLTGRRCEGSIVVPAGGIAILRSPLDGA